MAKTLDTYHTGQTGYTYPPNGVPGVVLITDDMPAWLQGQWRDAMKNNGIEPDPKPFEPGYKLAFGYDSISGMKWEMNSRLFADAPTLAFIAQRYGNGATREVDVLGPGPFSIDQKASEFQLKDERWINAGMIASFYTNNPESLFPGVADRLIRAALGL